MARESASEMQLRDVKSQLDDSVERADNDTSPKIEAMVNERNRQMTSDERVRIAASMFDTARAIVLSSQPPNLSRRERRLALARRFYARSSRASSSERR